MKIIVTDRETIQRGLVVRCTYVIISIADPGVPRARIKKVAGLKDVVYLSFHDASPTEGFVLPKGIKPMTRQQAETIWQFVQTHKDQVGAIVVQCHQGMSRSPAIAAALARYLQLEESPFHRDYQANEFIYRMMLDTMSRTSQDTLDRANPRTAQYVPHGCSGLP